ncbi:TlpA disulfide reductase family protein [Zavarzinella formosa]|uniref:TlpA disulfide reductase family protein n=1 Tax=Zavarzinella formosa TaxID=360055 RepID=UPI000364EEA4|nr:TlpA disulfide reductase family protein [Zavarzinella formosa]
MRFRRPAVALAALIGITAGLMGQAPVKDKADPKAKTDPKAKVDPKAKANAKDDEKSKFALTAKVTDLSLGTQLSGPKVTKEDLAGKVVMYDEWGINCPPCLAAMPATASLYKELGDFGLVVLGAHYQGGTPAEILSFSSARGATFPILSGSGAGETDNAGGLPHVFLFDHTGKCVFRGLPDEVENRIRVLVGEMIAASVTAAKPTASVAPVIADLKKGKSPVSMVSRLAPLVGSTNKDTAEQATALMDTITAQGRKKLDAATEKASDAPAEAFLLVENLPTTYKGSPVAKQATELITKLKKEKAVTAELAARPSLEAAKQLASQLSARLGTGGDPSKPEFRKANAATIKQLESKVAQMKKTWPDAKATAEADALAEKYGGSK